MKPRTRADVLILGDGPAGCAAAIFALQSGLSACVLGQRTTPRAHPGETLHPGVEPIFRQLGIWDDLLAQNFHRQRGVWREDADGRRAFAPYGRDAAGEWRGFQADRARLAEIFRARVRVLGGKMLPIARLEAPLFTGAKVAGVRADGCEWRAPAVLDATGRRAWLAEQLGLKISRHGPEQRVRFGWAADSFSALDGQPLFRLRADGWGWLAPLGGGRCAWAELRRQGARGGLDFAWKIRPECAGDGYFLLGDAACLLDPSAANGVLRACMSGIFAVHLLAAIRSGAAHPHEAAGEYRRKITEDFFRTASEMGPGAEERGVLSVVI